MKWDTLWIRNRRRADGVKGDTLWTGDKTAGSKTLTGNEKEQEGEASEK